MRVKAVYSLENFFFENAEIVIYCGILAFKRLNSDYGMERGPKLRRYALFNILDYTYNTITAFDCKPKKYLFHNIQGCMTFSIKMFRMRTFRIRSFGMINVSHIGRSLV